MTTEFLHTNDAITLATGQIVSAIFSGGCKTDSALDLVPSVIMSVRKSLTAPLTDPEPEAPDLVPAVPVRQSVKHDFIVCLEDGKKFKSLKRHLRTHFNLSPEQYREKWGLPADYPMVCAAYSDRRSQLAKDSGLGRKR